MKSSEMHKIITFMNNKPSDIAISEIPESKIIIIVKKRQRVLEKHRTTKILIIKTCHKIF